jgi:hypothetical protein
MNWAQPETKTAKTKSGANQAATQRPEISSSYVVHYELVIARAWDQTSDALGAMAETRNHEDSPRRNQSAGGVLLCGLTQNRTEAWSASRKTQVSALKRGIVKKNGWGGEDADRAENHR